MTAPSAPTDVVIRAYGPGEVLPMYRNTPGGPEFDVLLLRAEDTT